MGFNSGFKGLKSALEWSEWPNSSPGRFTPRERTSKSFYGGFYEPQRQSWWSGVDKTFVS